ncbi:SWPV1-192 [Shearwaterpox virus]|uniref:SWPV1-192 n=1 Tax=Shearwaterpox virus TaxID=1974596 RepID=A0A1V0S811_CNPV|nr:SWPV1-192 [Shearwaterpox virus]
MSRSEKLLKKAFEVLNRDGKKLMLDDLCISIAKNLDVKSCKFIELLQRKDKLDDELILRVYENINTINNYIKFSHSNCPDIINSINNIDSDNERLLNEINKVEDVGSKIRMIESVMKEFISKGSYESYLLLRIIQSNYYNTNDKRLNKITSDIVRRSINTRYKLL